MPGPGAEPRQRAIGDELCERAHERRALVRTLTVVDVYTREALALVADRSLTGVKVAAALSGILRRRPKPVAISVDNGTEFVSKAMDTWAYAHDVRLDFIRPGRPVEHAFIESFNGRLGDECLNSHLFNGVAEAQVLLDAWRDDYNRVRPHSALQDPSPGALRPAIDNTRPRSSTSCGLCNLLRCLDSD